MATLMLIISMLVAIGFVAVIMWAEHWRIPDSISALVFSVPRQWQSVWSAWLGIISLFLAPQLFAEIGDWWLLAFIFVVCLLWVAGMPLACPRSKMEHYIFAVIAGILSQVCVAIICPWWLALWAVALALYVWQYKKYELDGKGVFLSEVVCAMTLYGALLF